MSARPIELSVIIPTHNRRDLLRRCLEALGAQTQDPATFEVIVADDGSDDGTAAMVEGLSTPLRLRLLRLPKRGKSPALNAAIEAATAPACLFLDDDVIAAPELVAEHLAAHRGGPVLGIGAIVEQPRRRDWYARTFAAGWAEHNAELAGRPARWTDCYGANFSAPRASLEEIGGFTVGLAVAEDFEIALRLWQSGCEPTFLAQAIGVHDDQKRQRQMLNDARRQGAAHVQLCERYPQTRSALLDWHGGDPGAVELRLRRLCLALRFPPTALACLGRLIPGDGRKMLWLHFVRRLAFWSGVRAAAGGREVAALRSSGGAPTAATGASPFLLAIVEIAEILHL